MHFLQIELCQEVLSFFCQSDDRPKAVRVVDRSRNEVAELQAQLNQTMHLLGQEMDTTSVQHARLEKERKELTAQIKYKDVIIARTEGELDRSEALSLQISEELRSMGQELVTDQASSSKKIQTLQVSQGTINTNNANVSGSPEKPRAIGAITRRGKCEGDGTNCYIDGRA